MQKFEINSYKKKDGSCPVNEFMDSLDKKMRAKLLRTIALLEMNGNALREPHSKPLGDGIFELRIQHGSNITRVLYFFMMNHKIVLTHGFVKRSKKTSRDEIDLAKRYRDEYLRKEREQNE